ncbi:MAG: PD-(D/E)XK nuclease family protein [Saprospiraceae bacterium]
MKPNIFEIATKELSQDAFITWLLQWADSKSSSFDEDLNKCGRDFVTALIKKEFPEFDGRITSVRAGMQWEKIDVWAEVNNEYLIIIEDKTHTGQHSGQLSRYKTTAEGWCNDQNPKYKTPICIYLKTGNESQFSLTKVIEEGFKIYSRQEFLELLNKDEIENDVFKDFKENLTKIEKANNQWENEPVKNWKGNDWQGFYQFLERHPEIGLVRWDLINSLSGSFWNAVLNWNYWDIYPVYLQTEQDKLCFKLSTDPDEVDMPEYECRGAVRNRISELILDSAAKNGLMQIRRPDRFGSGKYMTIAIVDCENWLGNPEEKINKEQVVERLIFYKNFLIETISQEG